MFSGAASFGKLKTNLRLAVNRLKLLEKKKTELGLKARKEIADYIAAGKYERAKIRVEHIIREDYLVEAMEILEMYCDLLLARFGLIQQMKGLDDGLQEAISSLIWAAPRLQTDVTELKVISEQLTAKYGKTYAQACRENAVGTVSEKLMHKLGVQAPPKLLVEKYLIEIAKSHNVEYDPDPQVMRDDEAMMGTDALLIDMEGRGHTREEAPPHPPGFVSYPSEPLPPHKPFDYQPGGGEKIPFNPNAFDPSVDAHPMTTAARKAQEAMGTGMSGYPGYGTGGYPVMPPFPDSPPPYSSMPFDVNRPGNHPSTPSNGPGKPTPAPRSKTSPGSSPSNDLGLPDLPPVPDTVLPDIPRDNDNNRRPPGGSSSSNSNPSNSVDFDDLAKRFEQLKKRK